MGVREDHPLQPEPDVSDAARQRAGCVVKVRHGNRHLELAAHAVRNPKSLGYGTTGAGSGGHLTFEQFKALAGVSDEALPAVHYAGIAPEITALAAGQIQVAIMPLTSIAAAQIDAGTIRALGVTSGNRSPFRKEIPTVLEQGFGTLAAKDYISHWVLAKTPPAVVRKLADTTRAALENPEVRKRIEDLYLEAEFLDGPAIRRQFETRAAEFEPVIRRLPGPLPFPKGSPKKGMLDRSMSTLSLLVAIRTMPTSQVFRD